MNKLEENKLYTLCFVFTGGVKHTLRGTGDQIEPLLMEIDDIEFDGVLRTPVATIDMKKVQNVWWEEVQDEAVEAVEAPNEEQLDTKNVLQKSGYTLLQAASAAALSLFNATIAVVLCAETFRYISTYGLSEPVDYGLAGCVVILVMFLYESTKWVMNNLRGES